MADRISIEIGVDLKRAKSEINNFKKEVSKTGVNLGSATRGVSGVRNEIDKTTKSVGLLNASLLDSVRKFTLWFGIGTAISSINRALGNLIDTVRETDATVTTMAFTFEATDVQLQSMVSSTEEFAMSLGAVGSEALEAVKIFTNMSSTMDEILAKTQDVVVLNNLSKIGIENSTDALQSLQNQFNLTDEEASSLVDTLTFVSSNLKIDFSKGIQEIASGISASGKTAEQAGFSVEQYIALLGKSVEISRKSGSTVSAGFRTIFSRLRRVSDLSAEDLSKVEEAFRSVGLEVRATETTFKDMPTILTELVEKTRELDEANKETALSMIAEAAAGVRQKDTFLVMLDAWEDSLTLAEESTTKIGFAMQKNEIFVNSFAGQVNALKNEWEIFARDVLSIDFLTGIISGFREFVGILQATEDTFGLLNATMIITLPLFVAFKGQLIATAVIGFAESVFLASLYIKELGIVAGLAEIGVAGLTVAMGALTLGLSAVVASVVLYTRHQDKLNEEMKKTNESLQLQAGNWENLNEAQRENLKIKAQETIAETANKLDDANRKLENSKKAYEDLSQSIEKWTQVQADGGKLTETETELLEMAIDAREDHSKRIKESENIIEANAVAVAIINDNLEEYIRKAKEASESTDDLSQAEESQINSHLAVQAMQEKENERIQFLIDNYEFLSDRKKAEADAHIQGEIDKTNATIKGVRDRIDAYKKELSAIIATASGTDALRAEKQYMKLIPFLEEQIDDLTFKRNTLVNTQERMVSSIKETTKEVKSLTKEEKALLDVENRIAIKEKELARTEGEDRIPILQELKDLEFERNSDLQDLKDSLDEAKLGQDDYTEAINKYTLAQEDATNRQLDFEKSIQETSETIREEFKKSIEDNLKELENSAKDELKIYKDKEKDKLDEFIKAREEEIKILDEQLKDLSRSEKEEDFLSEKEKIEKQISKLEAEQLGIREAKGEQSAKRRFEIEKELEDATENLAKLKSSRSFELKRQEIEDEKDLIQDQIESEEEKYNRLIEEAESYYRELTETIGSFESEWENLGDRAGSAFASAFEEKISNLINQLNQITGADIPAPSGGTTVYSSAPPRDYPESKSKEVVVIDPDGKSHTIPRDSYEKYKDNFTSRGWKEVSGAATGGDILSGGLIAVHDNDETIVNGATKDMIANLSAFSSPMMGAQSFMSDIAGRIPSISPIGNSPSPVANNVEININNPTISDDIGLQKFSTEISRHIRDNLPSSGINLKPLGA